jgi:hypothetical protein
MFDPLHSLSTDMRRLLTTTDGCATPRIVAAHAAPHKPQQGFRPTLTIRPMRSDLRKWHTARSKRQRARHHTRATAGGTALRD